MNTTTINGTLPTDYPSPAIGNPLELPKNPKATNYKTYYDGNFWYTLLDKKSNQWSIGNFNKNSNHHNALNKSQTCPKKLIIPKDFNYNGEITNITIIGYKAFSACSNSDDGTDYIFVPKK